MSGLHQEQNSRFVGMSARELVGMALPKSAKGLKTLVGAQGLRTLDPLIKSSAAQDAQDWPKPAITLSRKNWLFCAIRAVLAFNSGR